MVTHRAAHRDGRAAAARAAGVVILNDAVHIDDNVRGIRAVSYTHLDVYKRQGEQRGKRGVDGTAHGLPDALLSDDLKRLLARGAQAVSYTHLDVYKRQTSSKVFGRILSAKGWYMI